MTKIRVAIIGYGNVGKGSLEAALAAPDMEVAGVVRRDAKAALETQRCLPDVHVATDIKELGKVDVAILGVPTRKVPETAKELLAQGISTVDSYDIHGELFNLRKELNAVAVANGTVAIISAGWDPGTDSMIRSIYEIIAPVGITYTNFGPGMSMGHSVAVRSIPGVADALSMTMPAGFGIHKRLVYVQLAEGASFEEVAHAIKTDPYFVHDETHVIQVENVRTLLDMGHRVVMERKGVAGMTHNQTMRFEMSVYNPMATGQVLVSAARAATRQKPGAYTMIEVPIVDFLAGDRDSLVKRLV